MNSVRRLIQYVYTAWAITWFIAMMLVVLVGVLLSPLLGKTRGGNFIYRLLNAWGRAWYFVTGIRHQEIYESVPDPKSRYIFVANHISYMDIPCIVRSIHQPVRILGKHEMVRYPIFGIIYRMTVVLVDRRNAERRAKSVRALKAALGKGLSIFIFPEGTFNETGQWLKDFYDGAFRIAIETQTPVQPILFVDTLERMHYKSLFALTPGRCRVVYLQAIPVRDYTLKEVGLLKQQVHAAMEQALKKYHGLPPASSLSRAEWQAGRKI